MPEPDLAFIARMLERVLGELRSMRDELRLMHGEMLLMREEMRITRASIARLDDTMRMNVLERLQGSPPSINGPQQRAPHVGRPHAVIPTAINGEVKMTNEFKAEEDMRTGQRKILAAAALLLLTGASAYAAPCENLARETDEKTAEVNRLIDRARSDPARNFNGPSWTKDIQQARSEYYSLRDIFHDCLSRNYSGADQQTQWQQPPAPFVRTNPYYR